MNGAFTFGPFQLLPDHRELLAHGVPVTMGQRAFDILLLLVSRHAQLVTKDELMAEIWPGLVVEENSIQVHVSALRKVLAKAGGDERYLVTIPGRGYRFVAPVESVSGAPAQTLAPSLFDQTAALTPTASNNLPQQLTHLIGREAEIAEIKDRLASHCLVTLTGAGGVGKTRLAIEAGRSLLDRYGNGVWLAELAPLNDAQLVTSTIGEVLGVSLTAPAAATDALVAALKGKQLHR
jgi:DNA-binding winged helix-turn-helix (wHTH) protein